MHKPINIDFSEPQVMTILNVTPDSFYAGSRTAEQGDIERRVIEAVEAGATIIDIGGYSSRPNAEDVSPEQEWLRVERGVAAVRRLAPDVVISVDTFRSQVAQQVVEHFGEVIINDITAGEADADMFAVAARFDLPYIAMHMRGTPTTMQQFTQYNDVAGEVADYLRQRALAAEACGVRRVILDPGFGFAKTTEQNYELLRGLHRIVEMGWPVLSGLSRKSMIYKVLGTTPDHSLAGTIALGWESLRQGASILRVHDTREAADTIEIFNAFK